MESVTSTQRSTGLVAVVIAEGLDGTAAVDGIGLVAVAEGPAGIVVEDGIGVVAAAETCAVVASGAAVADDNALSCGEQAEIVSAATMIKRTQKCLVLISSSRLSASL